MKPHHLAALRALPDVAPTDLPAWADHSVIGPEKAEIWALAHASRRIDRLWFTREQFPGEGPSGPRLPMGGWAVLDGPGIYYHSVEPTAAAIRRAVYDHALTGMPCGPSLRRRSHVGLDADTVIDHAFSPRLLYWAGLGMCAPYADARPLRRAPDDMVAEFSGMHREIMIWRGAASPVDSNYRLRSGGEIDLLVGPPAVSDWVLDRIRRAAVLAREAVPAGTSLADLRRMIVEDVLAERI